MNTAAQNIKDYIGNLSSASPVPGGGGAAAISGALGAALGSMVCHLTIGKKAYAKAEPRMVEIERAMEAARERFLFFADEDERVFLPLSEAYRLPKETEEEQRHKAAVMEDCLLKAAEVPLQVMQLCSETLPLMKELSESGSRMAVSDAAAGAVLLCAAAEAASMNVYINTKSMKDRERAEVMNREADRFLDTCRTYSKGTFQKVWEELLPA